MRIVGMTAACAAAHPGVRKGKVRRFCSEWHGSHVIICASGCGFGPTLALLLPEDET